MQHVRAMLLIVVIAAVGALLEPQLTGNIARVQGTWVGFRTTPEAPPLYSGLYAGESLAKEPIATCAYTMRYQPRSYSRYLRCCQIECAPKCLDADIAPDEIDDCIHECGDTCTETMTQSFLLIRPGTWR